MNYFEPSEISCRCGCGLTLVPELIAILNTVRKDYGKAISVSSGARCPARNKKIGGAKRSLHLTGRAVDLVRTPELLAFLLPRLEQYGLWMEDPKYTAGQPGWLHLDIGPRAPTKRVFVP